MSQYSGSSERVLYAGQAGIVPLIVETEEAAARLSALLHEQ